MSYTDGVRRNSITQLKGRLRAMWRVLRAEEYFVWTTFGVDMSWCEQKHTKIGELCRAQFVKELKEGAHEEADRSE